MKNKYLMFFMLIGSLLQASENKELANAELDHNLLNLENIETKSLFSSAIVNGLSVALKTIGDGFNAANDPKAATACFCMSTLYQIAAEQLKPDETDEKQKTEKDKKPTRASLNNEPESLIKLKKAIQNLKSNKNPNRSGKIATDIADSMFEYMIYCISNCKEMIVSAVASELTHVH